MDADALVERARRLAGLGHVEEAIETVGAALRRRPKDSGLFVLRARFHLNRRKFPRALADLKRAIALAPGDLEARAARRDALVMQGRLAQAQPDADALGPVERARLLLMRGRLTAAKPLIARLKRTAATRPQGLFFEGYAALKAARFVEAERLFLKLHAAPGADAGIGLKALYYAIVAKACAFDPGVKPPRGAHLLFGLGLFPPYDAPLEAFWALRAADVVFNNLPHPEVRELIHALHDEVRAATYDAAEDEFEWADAMERELKRGKTVGFATRGHPLMFGRLACEAVRRRRAREAPFSVVPCSTSVDTLLARGGAHLAQAFEGCAVYDAPGFFSAAFVDTARPVILNFYAGVTRREMPRVVSALKRRYPARHTVLVFGPKYDTDWREVPVAGLAKAYPDLHASLILFLPPTVKGGARARLARFKAGPGAELFVSGLGAFPPRQTPVAVLHALARADAAYVEDRAALPLARGFNRRATVLRDAAEITSDLAAGKRVAFVAKDHPMRFSPLCAALARGCREAGARYETAGSPAAHALLLSRVGVGLGDHIRGITVHSFETLCAARGLDTGSALALQLLRPARPREVQAKLLEFYPGSTPVLASGPDHDTPTFELRLVDLARHLRRMPAGIHLALPPKGGWNIFRDLIPGAPSGAARRRR